MTTIEMCALAFGLAFCVAFTVVTVAIQWYEWTWRERIHRSER